MSTIHTNEKMEQCGTMILSILIGCAVVTIGTADSSPAQEASLLPGTDLKLEIAGELIETTDFFGRKRFSGTIINKEDDRIDYIKVTFVLRDREGEIIDTAESYIKGQRHRFRDRQVSTSSLLPGRSGTFDIITSTPEEETFSFTYTISGAHFVYP